MLSGEPTASDSSRLTPADIPAEVLHQLYRDYCLSKHAYSKSAYSDESLRQAHIDYDARSYYEEAHLGPLAELVKAAYSAGREARWDDARTEYRVYHIHHHGTEKCLVDTYEELPAARESAQFFAASDPAKTVHWVSRIEVAEREVALDA